MHKLACFCLVLGSVTSALSQTNFRSNGTGGGNWNQASTWQVETPNGFGIWVPAATFPTSASNNISIRFGDAVTVTAGVAVDQTVVLPGGIVTVNDAVALTLDDGVGSDFIVFGDLHLLGESFLTGSGNVVMTTNGHLFLGSLNATGAIVTGTTQGNVRVLNRGYAATALVTYDGPGPQFLGNGHPATPGTMTIINNPFGVSLNYTGLSLVTIGDITILSGDLTVANNSLRVLGNIVANAGTINFNSGSTVRTFTVNGDMNLTGGNFAVTSGTASATVVVSGNMSLNGGSSSMSSGAATSSLKVTGNLNLTANDLTLSSGAGDVTLDVTGDISGANLVQSSGANSNIVVNGSGALTNTFPFASGASVEQLTWNRTSGTLTFPYSLNLKNLRVTNGFITTNVDLVITGDVNLATGTSFAFHGQDVTFQDGHFNNSLTGGVLDSDNSSTLSITGSGLLGTLAFDPAGNTISSITVNRPTAGTLISLSSPLTITTTFNLTDGDFVNTSGLNFGSGLLLTRNSNATLTGAAPTGGPYDVILNGSFMTTAAELQGPLRDLTSNSSATVTIGAGFTGTGAMTINTGAMTCGANNVSMGSLVNQATLNAPSTNLTLTGNFTNNGTFNKNNGTMVFNGTSSILGSSTPTFQNITISGTLNGGTGLALNGNFTNNGTFNGGASVVQFLGTTAQAVQGTSSSSFASFIVNKSAATTLTLSSGVSVATGVTLSVGRLDNTTAQLTMASASVFTRNSGTTYIGAAPGGGPYDVVYTGTLMSTSAEAQGSLMNVTNNLSITLTASTLITIPGTLTLNSGALANSANRITMGNGALIVRAGTATFTGAVPAGGPYDLTYNGANKTSGLEGRGTLRNVTNNLPGVLTISTAFSTINGTLFLSAGDVANAAGLINMANGATIDRNSAGTISGVVPAGGPYNLIYDGTSLTTLIEAQGSLNNVTTNASGTVTLANALSIPGTLTVNTGVWTSGANAISAVAVVNASTLNAPSSTLTLTGNFTDNGTFNANGGTVIFNGTTTMPGASSTNFNTIQLNTTKTLTLPASIRVAGHINFASGSTFNHGSGLVTINGGASQNIDAQTGRFYAVTVTKGGGSVDLLSAMQLENVLNITSATVVNSNGFLTVLSQPNGPGSDTGNDASIGPLTGGGSVAGNVIVQRFLIAKGIGNRYISTAVSGVGFSQFSDDLTIQSGYLRYYNEPTPGVIANGYLNVGAAPTLPLAAGRGYLLFVDANVNVQWDVTGPIHAGSTAFPVSYSTTSGGPTADGWNLAGNPYPSPIQWNNNGAAWSRTNVDPVTTVYDINGSASYTYNYTNGAGNLPNGMIATGQAFWVHLSAAGSMTVNEAAKMSGAGGTFFRTRNAPLAQITMSLTGHDFTDNSFLVLDANATRGFDPLYDGYKFKGEGPNIYFAEGDRHLVMNALDRVGEETLIPIEVQTAVPGNYTIHFSGLESMKESGMLYFVDLATGTSTSLNSVGSHAIEVAEGGIPIAGRFFLSGKPLGKAEKGAVQITAYPNPVRDFVRVTAGQNEVIEMKLFDASGNAINTGGIITEDGLDMRDFPNGIYFLKIRTSTGIVVKKLLKKN